MSCTRPPRNDEELQTAASHVTYEIQMLVVSASHLPYGFSSPADNITANMTLESFLLHFRNLRAFLCPRLQKLHDDDIVASDFWGASKPEDVGDATVLGRRKKEIDTRLTHLSYSRQEYSWPVVEMEADVRAELQPFFRKLPPKSRVWFREAEAILKSYPVRGTTGPSSKECTTTTIKTEILDFWGADHGSEDEETELKSEGKDRDDGR